MSHILHLSNYYYEYSCYRLIGLHSFHLWLIFPFFLPSIHSRCVWCLLHLYFSFQSSFPFFIPTSLIWLLLSCPPLIPPLCHLFPFFLPPLTHHRVPPLTLPMSPSPLPHLSVISTMQIGMPETLIYHFSSVSPLTRNSRCHRQRPRAGRRGPPCRPRSPRSSSSPPRPAEDPTTPGRWIDNAPPCSPRHNWNKSKVKPGVVDHNQTYQQHVNTSIGM